MMRSGRAILSPVYGCCEMTLVDAHPARTARANNHKGAQRGTIENTNGLFRRDMPRKTNLHDYSARDIDEITWAINSTPRKCLGFKTPAEAFLENLRCCT